MTDAPALNLTGRYHRCIPMDRMGPAGQPLALDPKRTALVAMHCWNIGCPDGPPADNDYRVGMGHPDTLAEADRILREKIRPAIDAARSAGVLVCHVECDIIARRHPEARRGLDPSPKTTPATANQLARQDRPCSADPAPTPEVIPGHRKAILERAHGREYPDRSPLARMDRAAIVMPGPGEPFVFQTGQFDRALRRRNIQNLVYCGFATDLCVLRAPGGIEPMAPFGYRLFLLRDATLGVEYPDTLADRIATRYATRYFEAQYGHTFTTDAFIAACRSLSTHAAARP